MMIGKQSPARAVKGEKGSPLSHPVYHDYSIESLACEDQIGERMISDKDAFPVKLHAMLEQSEASGYGTIIRWLPHGRAFKIYDKVRLEKEVLPRYFSSQTKYGSFQRQLNLYCFLRTTLGPERNAYYHERFLRGRPRLSGLIVRGRAYSNTVRRMYDPSSEPDFGRMPPVHALVPGPTTARLHYGSTGNVGRMEPSQPVFEPQLASLMAAMTPLQQSLTDFVGSAGVLLNTLTLPTNLGGSLQNASGALLPLLSTIHPVGSPDRASSIPVSSQAARFVHEHEMCNTGIAPDLELHEPNLVEPSPLCVSRAMREDYTVASGTPSVHLLDVSKIAGLFDPVVMDEVIEIFSKRSMNTTDKFNDGTSSIVTVSQDQFMEPFILSDADPEECIDSTPQLSANTIPVDPLNWIETIDLESFRDMW